MLLKLIFFISISLSLSLTKGELDDFTKNLIKTGTFVLDDDIHLSKRQIEMMKNEHHSASGRVKRVVSSLGYHQWTEFPIKYKIRKHVNKTLIRRAIKKLEEETCLTFKENRTLPKNGTNGLYFVNDGYCYGELGRSVRGGVQNVSITEECQEMGTILHEIGHALGMQHEHNRVDRDQHIYIDWDKIGQANQTHFYIENNTFTLNIKYDYGSAMHYVRRAGREKNGTETIYANITAYKYTMGQRNSFSFLDWKTLNRFYCKDKCKDAKKIQCYHGGYQDPKNCSVCKCPTFFDGPYCKTVMKSDPECGRKIIKVTNTSNKLFEKGRKKCYYILRTDPGYKIKIKILATNLTVDDPCSREKGLQIKFLEAKTISSAGFCGEHKCLPPIISEINNTLIYYNGESDDHFFKIKYRRVK